MKTTEMTKNDIVKALGYRGYEAKKAMRRTKEDLLTEYETINNVVDYTVDIDTTMTKEDTVMNTQITASKAAPRFAKTLPQGVEVCAKRGINVKVIKDWKAFNDMVNRDAIKILTSDKDNRKEGTKPEFCILYKKYMVSTDNRWFALAVVLNKVTKKQCACLFEGEAHKRALVNKAPEYLKF